MKRTLFILCCLLLASGNAVSQTTSDDTEIFGTFKLRMVDKHGRTIKKPDVVVMLSSESIRRPVIFDGGVATIQRKSPADTLFIVSGKSVAALPIADLDSVTIRIQGKQMLADDPRSADMLNTGYGFVLRDDYTQAASHLDLSRDRSISSYPDLASYLEGRVAGLRIVRGRSGEREVQIRGQSSIMMSNAALIVVDGITFDSFEVANSAVNIHDVQSVDVLKDGSMYGLRGANGVVVITTKSGGSRRR